MFYQTVVVNETARTLTVALVGDTMSERDIASAIRAGWTIRSGGGHDVTATWVVALDRQYRTH